MVVLLWLLCWLWSTEEASCDDPIGSTNVVMLIEFELSLYPPPPFESKQFEMDMLVAVWWEDMLPFLAGSSEDRCNDDGLGCSFSPVKNVSSIFCTTFCGDSRKIKRIRLNLRQEVAQMTFMVGRYQIYTCHLVFAQVCIPYSLGPDD